MLGLALSHRAALEPLQGEDNRLACGLQVDLAIFPKWWLQIMQGNRDNTFCLNLSLQGLAIEPACWL